MNDSGIALIPDLLPVKHPNATSNEKVQSWLLWPLNKRKIKKKFGKNALNILKAQNKCES